MDTTHYTIYVTKKKKNVIRIVKLRGGPEWENQEVGWELVVGELG